MWVEFPLFHLCFNRPKCYSECIYKAKLAFERDVWISLFQTI